MMLKQQAIVLLLASLQVEGFLVSTKQLISALPLRTPSEESPVMFPQRAASLLMAGRGMGMAASSKKKNKTKKKGGNGMGKKAGGSKRPSSGSATFDVSASVNRLEKRYDEMLAEAAKQMNKEEEDPRWASSDVDDDKMTSEYIVAARAPSKAGVNDWVPFAQLCLVRPEEGYENSQEIIQAAVSSFCRELSHVAAFGAPIFSTVARNDLQYSIESIESFHKHVYEVVVEGIKKDDENRMTKSNARTVLGLDAGESEKSTIKQAYRRLSFELHPDRFEGTSDECEAAKIKFAKVKSAYETLSSGVRDEGGSWYQSLGGRARTDFTGPINLLPLSAAQEQMSRQKTEGAIVGLEPDLIQSFVARNLRSE